MGMNDFSLDSNFRTASPPISTPDSDSDGSEAGSMGLNSFNDHHTQELDAPRLDTRNNTMRTNIPQGPQQGTPSNNGPGTGPDSEDNVSNSMDNMTQNPYRPAKRSRTDIEDIFADIEKELDMHQVVEDFAAEIQMQHDDKQSLHQFAGVRSTPLCLDLFLGLTQFTI